VKEMPTFAAVAMAGNNPTLPDDTRSRVIRVLLLPDIDGTVDESSWEIIEAEALGLHDKIATWAGQVREEVAANRPKLPEGITGRFREKWSPLKRIADAADGRWPNAVDRMALSDRETYEMDKADGVIQEKPSVVLLSHIRRLWPDGVSFISTESLILRLIHEHPAVWGAHSRTAKR
jgi:hypothetical protein